MPHNILIIDSSKDCCVSLVDLWVELNNRNYSFYFFWTKLNKAIKKIWREYSWPNRRIYLGPAIVDDDNYHSINFVNFIIFLLILPILCFKLFIILTYYKYGKKIKTVICGSWNEKLIITLVARMLRIRVIWLEYPSNNYQGLNRLFLWLYWQNRKLADILCFTSKSKIKLHHIGSRHKPRSGAPGRGKDIKVINPGIKPGLPRRQETIFKTLAQSDYRKSGRKFFTLGTVVSLNKQQKLEVLLHAVKKSLTVIPNLQLIIAEMGEEKKKLAWLAKKMEIDSLVWFVGGQGHTKKWLDSFDVFVVATDLPKLDDIKMILRAMAAGLPVIAPSDAGLDDFIEEHKTGLLYELNNSERLARHIITLEQKNNLRSKLGRNAQKRVDQYFLIDKMVEQMEEVLK